MSSGALVLFLVFVLIVVMAVTVGLMLFIRFAMRRYHEEGERATLASRWFTGAPEVAVVPSNWRLGIDDIRALAAQRGYQEAGQPQPGVVLFRRDTRAPGPVVPARPVSARASELLAPLATRDFVWVEAAVIGGTDRDIAALAMQHGARVLRTYGDRTNPMLLIGKRPVASVRDVLDAGRKPLRSMTQHWLSRGVALAAAAPGIAAGVLASRGASGVVLWTLVAVAAALLIGGSLALARFLFGHSVTTRMTRLIREFDGRPRVTIAAQHYRFDRLTYHDVAAELGYGHMWTNASWMTGSRWNQSWIFFTRQSIGTGAVEGRHG